MVYDTEMQKYIKSQKESYSPGFLIRMQMPDRTFQKSWLSINHIRKCFCSPAKKIQRKENANGSGRLWKKASCRSILHTMPTKTPFNHYCTNIHTSLKHLLWTSFWVSNLAFFHKKSFLTCNSYLINAFNTHVYIMFH